MENNKELSLNFKTYLQDELIRRCQKNNQYSLRSFAKFLNISHSALSLVLNGKRNLSTKTIRKLAITLCLPPDKIDYYLNENKTNKEFTYKQISNDTFHIISDWYHFALLELVKVPELDHDIATFSNMLGVSKLEISSAIERLQRLNMLKKEQDGKYISITNDEIADNSSHTFTTSAKKKFQRQTFQLALEAIDKFDIEKRSHSSMTMAINSNRIKEAKHQIIKFRHKICGFLQEGDLDDVYHLSIGLFPLTKFKEN